MIVAIGRARKDAKALSHALRCEIASLGGIRNIDNFDLSVFNDRIPVFFFGKDEMDMVLDVEREIADITPVFNIVVLNKKSVRNTRLEEIRKRFEFAKAEIRLGMKFDEIFEFSRKNEMGIAIHPDYDEYFIIGVDFVKNLLRVGIDTREGNLILRKLYNIEEIYVPELKAILSKRRGEKMRVECLSDVEPKEIELRGLIERNRIFLKKLEDISIKFIRENAEKAGVPFSGGKDSLACLILAKKALKDVTAIYIKTNYDVPQNEEYVNRICDELRINLITKRIELNIEKYGMPGVENRWCTNLKIKALHETVKEEGLDTLIIGDRDAESRNRRLRPEIIEMERFKEIFPVKYWSGAMVQLYVLMNNLDLNPYYYKGFYRLGCTICPYLSDWERTLLKT